MSLVSPKTFICLDSIFFSCRMDGQRGRNCCPHFVGQRAVHVLICMEMDRQTDIIEQWQNSKWQTLSDWIWSWPGLAEQSDALLFDVSESEVRVRGNWYSKTQDNTTIIQFMLSEQFGGNNIWIIDIPEGYHISATLLLLNWMIECRYNEDCPKYTGFIVELQAVSQDVMRREGVGPAWRKGCVSDDVGAKLCNFNDLFNWMSVHGCVTWDINWLIIRQFCQDLYVQTHDGVGFVDARVLQLTFINCNSRQRLIR